MELWVSFSLWVVSLEMPAVVCRLDSVTLAPKSEVGGGAHPELLCLCRHCRGATGMVSCSPGPQKVPECGGGRFGANQWFPVPAGNHKSSTHPVWGCMAVGVRRMACMRGAGLWFPVPKLGGSLSPQPQSHTRRRISCVPAAGRRRRSFGRWRG